MKEMIAKRQTQQKKKKVGSSAVPTPVSTPTIGNGPTRPPPAQNGNASLKELTTSRASSLDTELEKNKEASIQLDQARLKEDGDKLRALMDEKRRLVIQEALSKRKLQEEDEAARKNKEMREKKKRQLEAVDQAREKKRIAREKLNSEMERMRLEAEAMQQEEDDMERMTTSLSKELEDFDKSRDVMMSEAPAIESNVQDKGIEGLWRLFWGGSRLTPQAGYYHLGKEELLIL